ncbi:hypothetical protein [Actinoallomurus rhizosphaericola]|uniref:hypothetical protein n=1 Tax=Actinoallomurus rhizosphaericola TaxID=2952536 RepID=UPI0020922A4B|nr:hypothetical protein [Actinoallomurus rhizosphaericola]MCO5996268.1 hypothetical protein [Actinoallomurus rhizosphaericola]
MDQSRLGDAKVAVLQSLQSRLTRRTASGVVTERNPGSRVSLIVERAIDYALSSRRTQSEPAFLEHDVLHDAELASRRTADAEARTLAAIATLTAPDHIAFGGRVDSNTYSLAAEARGTRSPSVRTHGPAVKVAGTALVSTITPEDVAVAGDLERRLRVSIKSSLGAVGVHVLDGMIDGESISETARRLNVSTRTIDRARREIRLVAFSIFEADEIAA